MQTRNLVCTTALGIVALMSACTKKGDTGPAGPSGPSYTGAISGHVSLFDQYGGKVLTGLNVPALQLNSGTPVNPDNNGYYIFNNTTTGDYTLSASASGYASTKVNKFQYLSDTLNRDIKLSAIPSFSPTAITVYSAIAAPGDSVIINFNADAQARNCIIFINSNSTVGNTPANYLVAYTKAIPANQTKITISLSANDLHDAGITSGSTFYIAAYGYVVADASVYEDIATGKNVYNAVSVSPLTASAVAP